MIKRPRKETGSVARGGLLPLLDTLFLLLFSLLAMSEASDAREDREVLVELPSIETEGEGRSDTAREVIVIVISEESDVSLLELDLPISSFEELDAGLTEALGGRVAEEVTIELRADGNSRHGVAVTLLEHLRRLGFIDVQLSAVGNREQAEQVFEGGDE